MTTLHLLVVEDTADIAANIIDYLESKGHVVDYAATGTQGLQMALDGQPDLVLLDLMLPGMDGWEVMRRLREESHRHLPVLMLTARDSLEDKVLGFELGADDYLTKPFALEELHARCQALSRRHRLHESSELAIGPLTINRQSRQVSREGQTIQLTTTGYQILLILAEASPGVVTRSQLTMKLWGDEPPESDALRSHVYQLRQALDKPYPTPLIKTVHGAGLSLSANVEHP
jgi:DNA-binding response OmpR family regulator